LKLLWENSGKTFEETGNYFISWTPIAQDNQQMGSHKIKKHLSIKENNFQNQEKTEGEKIFASYSSGKGIISRIDKELKKLNNKRTNYPIKKRTNEWNK
jgi:hypothetical protein